MYGLLDQATKYKGKYLPVKTQELQVNDVVLIKDPFVKAPNFPLARVLKVSTNTLGEVTSAELYKANKSVVRRDVSALILLVRGDNADDDPEPEKGKIHSIQEIDNAQCNPKRVAALRCRRRITELYDSSDV